MLDVPALRAQTPGCASVTHLNNAGAALPPQPVLDTVVDHLHREATIGGYEAADEAADRLEAVYGSIARLLGCAPDEVAVVENATRAWDAAFYALAARLGPGDRVLTSNAEYASNVIALLQVARQRGVSVEVVPDDVDGQVSVDALREMVDERVRLIALTHVPTQSGLVNPAEAVGEVAADAGVPYLLDACQSVGQLEVDVRALHCDLLSATSRKFLRGPRGVGFLHVSRRLVEELEPPFLDLHAATWTASGSYEVRPDARRFETWETNVAAKLGLGAAVDLALDLGLAAIEERVTALAEELRTRLRELAGVEVHDPGRRRCAIVTFTVAGHPAREVAATLRARRINVSVSSATSARFDFEHRGLPDLVRASVHYYNDDADLDRLLDAVGRLSRER